MGNSFKFLDSPIQSFNIEGTNWCYLKCSACDRTIRKDHVKKRNDLDIGLFERLISIDLKDVNLDNIQFNFCGIYGDNLYHPDILNFFKILVNRNARIDLETNGSYKKSSFWKQLAEVLTSEDKITFSIDGMADTNSIYRKGSSWDSIIEGVKIIGQSKIKSTWKFIVFKHNQHQIDGARKLATSLGVDEFLVRYSGRFLKNDPLLPDPEYIGLQQLHWDKVQNAVKRNTLDVDTTILPRCLSGKNIGITNEGLVIPCLTFHSIENKWLQDNRDRINLHNRSILDILNDDIWIELKELWNTPTKAPFICSKYCGVPNNEINKLPIDRIKKADYSFYDL